MAMLTFLVDCNAYPEEGHSKGHAGRTAVFPSGDHGRCLYAEDFGSVQVTVNSIHRELRAKLKPLAGGEKKSPATQERRAAFPAKDGTASAECS